MKKDVFTIQVDDKRKLIRYCHSGSLMPDSIGKAWDEFLQLEEFTHKKYNLLTDYRNAEFMQSVEAIDEIVSTLMELKPILNGKKQALIVAGNKETALSLLFEGEAIKRVGFLVKTFVTVESALKWLCE